MARIGDIIGHRQIPPEAAQARRWGGFAGLFVAVAMLCGAASAGFVALLDPYGLRAGPGRAPGPIMDLNQRFMYPQIARSGAFDAAVIGTSTARLLDPRDLDAALGARFANLAMNAATPFEQTKLAQLFLRHAPVKALVLALDATWCEAQAEARRLTFRPFPPWLYEPGAPFGTVRQVNWQSLATAARVLLFRLGLASARIRGDGFAVFTPPERSYDPARAAAHIHGGRTALDEPEESPGPAEPAQGQAKGIDAPMPALAWLDALLAQTPPAATRIVAFMPVHAVVQGRLGTPQGAREEACKARVAAIGRARGASVVDFRIPSPLTTDDAKYWDALHYRLPVAGRIVAGLKEARESGRHAPDGLYRVLASPQDTAQTR